MNKVLLVGHVGQEPQINETAGGKKVANFSLATKEYFEEETQWHRCVVWNKTAEIVEKYVGKGTLLSIEGHIRYGSYDKDDGTKVYTTDISVSQLELLGGTDHASSEEQGMDSTLPYDEIESVEAEVVNDLPFGPK